MTRPYRFPDPRPREWKISFLPRSFCSLDDRSHERPGWRTVASGDLERQAGQLHSTRPVPQIPASRMRILTSVGPAIPGSGWSMSRTSRLEGNAASAFIMPPLKKFTPFFNWPDNSSTELKESFLEIPGSLGLFQHSANLPKKKLFRAFFQSSTFDVECSMFDKGYRYFSHFCWPVDQLPAIGVSPVGDGVFRGV